MSDICLFCEQSLKYPITSKNPINEINTSYFSCNICGDYYLTRDMRMFFNEGSPYKKESIKISVFIKKQNIMGQQKPLICYDLKNISEDKREYFIDLEKIVKSFPKTIGERIDNILLILANKSIYTGAPIDITPSKDYPIFHPDNIDQAAIKFMIKQLLEDKYIIANNDDKNLLASVNQTNSTSQITLTTKGWDRIIELQNSNKYSKKVFVAMWFDKIMTEARKTIKSAIEDEEVGNFKAVIIDEEQYNGDITDKIIAEIKRSKFIVADLTGDRGGVYYEAGFAQGLNIPVILTCRKDWFNGLVLEDVTLEDNKTIKRKIQKKAHFDVNHLNIIVWETEEELRQKLIDRIRATID